MSNLEFTDTVLLIEGSATIGKCTREILQSLGGYSVWLAKSMDKAQNLIQLAASHGRPTEQYLFRTIIYSGNLPGSKVSDPELQLVHFMRQYQILSYTGVSYVSFRDRTEVTPELVAPAPFAHVEKSRVSELADTIASLTSWSNRSLDEPPAGYVQRLGQNA